MAALKFRNENARRRAFLVERALRHADGSAEREQLRRQAVAMLTPWERALYELHLYYAASRSLHGSWADAFLVEFTRGCATRSCFTGIMVDILDLEPASRWSDGMRRLVEAARTGNLQLDQDDRDLGALLGGARG